MATCKLTGRLSTVTVFSLTLDVATSVSEVGRERKGEQGEGVEGFHAGSDDVQPRIGLRNWDVQCRPVASRCRGSASAPSRFYFAAFEARSSAAAFLKRPKPRSRSSFKSSRSSNPTWKRTVGPPGAQRVAVR